MTTFSLLQHKYCVGLNIKTIILQTDGFTFTSLESRYPHMWTQSLCRRVSTSSGGEIVEDWYKKYSCISKIKIHLYSYFSKQTDSCWKIWEKIYVTKEVPTLPVWPVQLVVLCIAGKNNAKKRQNKKYIFNYFHK